MQSFYRIGLAHFEWPVQPHMNNVLHWVRSVARGNAHLRYTTIAPEFVQGESIARACR